MTTRPELRNGNRDFHSRHFTGQSHQHAQRTTGLQRLGAVECNLCERSVCPQLFGNCTMPDSLRRNGQYRAGYGLRRSGRKPRRSEPLPKHRILPGDFGVHMQYS